MCVCVCVCVPLHVYVCTSVCVPQCARSRWAMGASAEMPDRNSVDKRTLYTCGSTHTRAYTHTRADIYMHLHAEAHTHTHTHTLHPVVLCSTLSYGARRHVPSSTSVRMPSMTSPRCARHGEAAVWVVEALSNGHTGLAQLPSLWKSHLRLV